MLRGCDRIEAGLTMLVVAFVLTIVPFAAAYGSVTYGTLAAQAQQQRQTNRHVEATVLGLAPLQVLRPGAEGSSRAGDEPDWVQWSTDGGLQIGRWAPAIDMRPGEMLELWVDENGTPVAAPHSGSDIAVTAVLAAVAVWTAPTAVACVGLYGFHRRNEHRRLTQWEDEWRTVGTTPGWSVD